MKKIRSICKKCLQTEIAFCVLFFLLLYSIGCICNDLRYCKYEILKVGEDYDSFEAYTLPFLDRDTVKEVSWHGLTSLGTYRNTARTTMFGYRTLHNYSNASIDAKTGRILWIYTIPKCENSTKQYTREDCDRMAQAIFEDEVSPKNRNSYHLTCRETGDGYHYSYIYMIGSYETQDRLSVSVSEYTGVYSISARGLGTLCGKSVKYDEEKMFQKLRDQIREDYPDRFTSETILQVELNVYQVTTLKNGDLAIFFICHGDREHSWLHAEYIVCLE